MANNEALDNLRHDYPDIVENYIDTQPVWGYHFSIGQPLGHLALEAIQQSLQEQLEVAAVKLETLQEGAIPAYTILDMLIRGVSAKAANQNANRIVGPRFGADRIVEAPVVSVQPLMPEQAQILFERPDARIPDIDDSFSAMMNPAIL